MKKNKLYTVNRYNRPAFMPHADYTTYDLGGIINGVTDKLGGVFGGSKLASTPGGSLVGALGTAVGGAANKILSGGLNSGAGNAVANIGGTVGGLISNVNPLLGGIVSAGTGIIGGGINALFGTKVDKEKLAAVNSDIARGRNFVSKAGTFEDIRGPEAFMTDTNVHSGGLLVGGNARRKNDALRKDLTDAALFAERSVDNNINNIWEDMVNDALYNYSAFGGPLDSYSGALGLMQNDKYIDAINNRSDAIMGKNNTLSNPQNYFGNGGGIHIKKANEGKFTAQANRAGMGVQEYASHVLANKEDYPAATVKRANFARNAAKWHAFGGELGTNGTDWTNGLLYVDNGGTHEQNPLGGIPVGFDQNGTPNLVEEGETIWNDYVFSNRIKVPKAMFHTLGLGGAMKKNRLTFADASKKLAKESEQRPNDPISMAGLEASLSKLAAVQEAERMKKQMRESVGLENMAAYGGPVNKFVKGGDLKNTNIPTEYQGTYQDIVDWLMENNLEASDAAIRKYAKDFYSNKSLNFNRAAAYKWLSDNTDYNQAVITKLADLMAKRPSANMSGNFSPEDAFDSLIPTRLFTEGNIEKYLKNFMDNGLSFDDAWNVVNHSTPKEDSLQQRRYNAQLQARLRDKYNKGLSSVADSVSTEEMPEEVSTNSDIKWGIQNAMQEAAKNGALQTQRGITVGNTSSGIGYTGTPGVRNNRNNGFTGDRAFAKSLDDLMNGAYGFTPSNGAQYIPYTGMSEADVRAIENDPRFQRWTNYVLDNFDNKDNATVQNYLQWLDSTAGGNHMFDTQGNLLPGAKDYYTNARTQNHLMGYYHLTPENWEATQETNTQASGEPQIMSAEEEEATRNNVAVQPSSNLPQPTGTNGKTNPGVDLGGRTFPVNDKRPLLDASLRYAPAIGGALGVFGDMLGLTNKPDYTYADRLEAAANAAGYAPQVGYKPIGDYERYTPFDRLFYANQLQANARGTDRMLANTSSPSRAAGLLANAYNTNNALGNLYRQGDEYNLAQYQQVKDFNRRTNMFNSQMGLEADIANARYRQMAKNYQMEGLGRAAALRDSIDQRVGAARSANLTNFFNSLGNIGRENFIFNQINQDPSRGYGYQDTVNGGWGYWPKFMQDTYQKDVESAAQRMLEEERKKNAETQKTTQSASGAYGGKLKRNKK